MALVDQADAYANWFEVLALWSRIANWIHYRTSEPELKRQMKTFLVFLWNEKDWLKDQYPMKSDEIEEFINNSQYMAVVGDLANTIKHRRLTKRSRSSTTQTNYYGRITVGCGVTRRLHYINLGGTKHTEIMQVLRGALDEFENLRFALRSGSV